MKILIILFSFVLSLSAFSRKPVTDHPNNRETPIIHEVKLNAEYLRPGEKGTIDIKTTDDDQIKTIYIWFGHEKGRYQPFFGYDAEKDNCYTDAGHGSCQLLNKDENLYTIEFQLDERAPKGKYFLYMLSVTGSSGFHNNDKVSLSNHANLFQLFTGKKYGKLLSSHDDDDKEQKTFEVGTFYFKNSVKADTTDPKVNQVILQPTEDGAEILFDITDESEITELHLTFNCGVDNYNRSISFNDSNIKMITKTQYSVSVRPTGNKYYDPTKELAEYLQKDLCDIEHIHIYDFQGNSDEIDGDDLEKIMVYQELN